MKLPELEELKDFNEFDILYKIIDKAESIKKTTEKTLKGNKTAGIEVRRVMQEIRTLSEIMRDKILFRRNGMDEDYSSKLFKEIKKAEIKLEKEKIRLERLEDNRRKRMEIKRQNM
jgi:hypothetical protein